MRLQFEGAGIPYRIFSSVAIATLFMMLAVGTVGRCPDRVVSELHRPLMKI